METSQSNQRWHPPLAVYQYEPLDKEPVGTIRILELHPGTYNDPIKITLSLASIDRHGALPAVGPIPHADQDYASYMDLLAKRMNQLKLQMRMWKASFQALSYEWGEDGDCGDPISINGLLEPNPIRRNLEVALRTIRDKNKENVLWIDSICINQNDPMERGQQVAMMGDIFSAATGVIAWLGQEANGSNAAMDLIQNTHKLDTRMCLDRDLSESEMQALVNILHRTYWRRVWVIQELLMAKTCEIRCGSKIITRKQFNNFLGCINRPGTQFEDSRWAKARAGNPAEAHRLAHEFNIPGTTFKRLNTLRIWLRRCYKSGFEATDPRDLVYALIGAADDVPQGHLVPNYEGTVRDALLQAVPYVREDVSPWSPSVAQNLAFFMVQYAERMGLEADDDLLQEILDIMNQRPVLSS